MEKCYVMYKALYHVIVGILWYHWTHFNNGYSEKMTSTISQCSIKEGTRNQRWKSQLSTQDIARICYLRRWAKGGKSRNLSPRELVKDHLQRRVPQNRTVVQNQGAPAKQPGWWCSFRRVKKYRQPNNCMAPGLPLQDSSLTRAQWSLSLVAVLVKFNPLRWNQGHLGNHGFWEKLWA